MAKQDHRKRIKLLYPIFVTGEAVSHIALSLCQHMSDDRFASTFTSAGHVPNMTRGVDVRNPSPWAFRFLYRCGADAAAFTERHYLRDLRAGDAAYFWPACSLSVYERARERGCLIVKEMINCHQAFAKRVLDAESRRLGRQPSHDITDEKIAQERAELALSDVVFAPGPAVVDSLLAEGVEPKKIIPTTYGWAPHRILGSLGPPREKGSGPRVLFLGRGCLRKGLHLLLEAWERIGSGATLVIAGKIDQEIVEGWGHILCRPDVECLGYTRDVAGVLARADLFVFPSLEEGGPQVSYEALAAGLPAVVSPMGAGAIVRHGRDGFVIDPYDTEAWVVAIGRLIADEELRAAFRASGITRAQDFTWQKVARRRNESLTEFLADSTPRQAVVPHREKAELIPGR